MPGSGNVNEVRKVWAWGNPANLPLAGKVNVGSAFSDVVNSTGAGSGLQCHGLARETSFYIETDGAATCSYQIRTARSTGSPYVVISSGTLSTGQTDLVQITGPLLAVSPRIKTLNSTANGVVITMVGN